MNRFSSFNSAGLRIWGVKIIRKYFRDPHLIFLAGSLQDLSSPMRDLNPRAWQWKQGVLTTEEWKWRVVSNSLRPHGLYSPWNSPGQNTGVGSLFLLQGIFLTRGSNPGLLCCRWILYQLSHWGSPKTLEWIACPFSSGSSWPRTRIVVSCIAGRFLTSWATREALLTTGLQDSQGIPTLILHHTQWAVLSCKATGRSCPSSTLTLRGRYGRAPAHLTCPM